MTEKPKKYDWDEFKNSELKKLEPILLRLGFRLDAAQVHIGGERYLMSVKKLVLNGIRIKDKKKVIIKAARDKKGQEEIKKEHITKKDLNKLAFAYHKFYSPAELLYIKKNAFIISISEYIEEKKAFLNHSLEEQFFLSLRAFEIQEGAHATTYSHFNKISKTFGRLNSRDYLKLITEYANRTIKNNSDNNALVNALNKSLYIFKKNINIIEEYCGFITHSDFVIHNLRIVNKNIFLLDHSSLHFGNKYESWARFLNFMILYNKPLEEVLISYIKDNRDKNESLCLRLMRIYKIAFLLYHYSNTLNKSDGNLLKLNKIRINFWSCVLESLTNNKEIKKDTIDNYIISRNKLRSDEEKNRQKELNQILN